MESSGTPNSSENPENRGSENSQTNAAGTIIEAGSGRPPRERKFVKFLFKNLGILSLGILSLFVFFAEKAFPEIEEKTDEYFEKVLFSAGTTFAVARVVDSGISVVKESTIKVTPMGIGTDLALGQILDPVDDAVERLSDILFAAIESILIQKIVYELIGEFAFYGIFTAFVLALFCEIFIRHENVNRVGNFLKKACLLLIFARIAMPCSVLVSSQIEENFFQPRIEECTQRLKVFTSKIEFNFGNSEGFFEKAKLLSKKVPEVVKIYAENASSIVKTSLDIAGFYIALFLVQVIFIPLLGLFLLVKAANLLFALELPVVVKLPKNRLEKEKLVVPEEVKKS